MNRVRTLAGHVVASLQVTLPVVTTATASRSHLVGWVLPKPDVLQAFMMDPKWADQKFWMLNVLKFKGDRGKERYGKYAAKVLDGDMAKFGGRIVLHGTARTVIGRREFDSVAIAEWPSPKVFMDFAMDSGGQEKFRDREAGLDYQLLVPMRPGWYQIDTPAPAPTKPLTSFTMDNVWSTPNGMVGRAVPNARVGVTSSTQAQAEAFVQDARFGESVLWHLNLLKFHETDGQSTYNKYAKAMGTKDGVLSQVGSRSTLSARCFRSLIGEPDFDKVIIAEYPCRDAYLTMGASDDYLKVAHFRHEGLEQTYIVSVVPEKVEPS